MTNSLVIDGRVGGDPEKRGSENGPVTFSICWNKSRKLPDGEWESTPNWFNVLVWGKQREQALTLRKGDLVVIGGRLETNVWEDKEGKKRTDVQIVADSLGKVPSVELEASDW